MSIDSNLTREERIQFYEKKLGKEIIKDIFSIGTAEINTNDIINNNHYKEIQEQLNILSKIYSLGLSYERTILKSNFINFLTKNINLNIDITENDSFCEIIYKLYKKHNDIFCKLASNYDISFGGTFKFFRLNLEKYSNNLKLFLEKFNENLSKINEAYSRKSNNNPIMSIYSKNTIDDYYIIYYGFNKKNNKINYLYTSSGDVESSNNFYFFFLKNNLETGIKYIVFKQPFHINQITYFLDSINSIMGEVCIYGESNIINFNDFDKNLSLNSEEIKISPLKIKAISTDFSNISIEGKGCLEKYKTLVKNYNNKEIINFITKDLKLLLEKYNGKSLLYKIKGEISYESIKIEGKKLNIKIFINHLEKLGLFKNENISEIFSMHILTKDLLFSSGKIILDEKYYNNIDEFEDIIKKYEYCGSKIDDHNVKNTSKSNINFKNNSVSYIINNKTETDTIINNIICEIDVKEILSKKIKKKIKKSFDLIKEDNLFIIKFSNRGKGKYKNTIIIFSKSLDYLTGYLTKNHSEGFKYLAFINSDFKDKEKINLLNKFQCIPYNQDSIERFLNNYESFIIEESSKIIFKTDSHELTIPKRGNNIKNEEYNVFTISKSGNGTEFEDITAGILQFFFSIFIKLGSNYIGKPLPDGLVIDNNNEKSSILLYDSKSSNNIQEYLNDENRKLGDYIGLFPENGGNNLFLIIGPETDENITSISKNPVWSKNINEKKGKFLYLGADVLDFLHYIINFEDYLKLRSVISNEEFIKHLLEQVPIPDFKRLQIKEFISIFKDDIISTPNEINKNVKEVNKKLREASKGKFNLTQDSEKFKKYIEEYRPLDKNNKLDILK